MRRLQPHEWQAYRAIRLQALADAPDAFGATLAEAQAWPLTEWETRLARAATSGIDCPLGAEMDGQLVGLCWAKVDAQAPDLVNLYQMWVAPAARCHGVARALLDQAVAWAQARGARRMQLGVNCTNAGALRLYTRAGFVAVDEPYPMRPGETLMEQRMRLGFPL
ncbi:GNAT family N-acetyltransferase [Massilia phyllostachyos]|uniref:GNAT family N-acetyltransferase n=1 Tax=Massilia phyllostachyos TaxID=2898585 RepID=UPI0035313DB0